jgi:hypothetical protein
VARNEFSLVILAKIDIIARPVRLARAGIGEVTEWLKVRHWKCRVRVTVPGVRIPPSPLERLRSVPVAIALRDATQQAFFVDIGRESLEFAKV